MRRCLTLSATVLAIASAAPPAMNAQDTAAVRVSAQGILVDFQDTDIRFVITALSEAGGLNVIYTDLPARRITLRMRQPVPRENILPLLRSIALSNGLRLHEEAGLIRIEVTGADAGVEGTPTDSSGRGAAQSQPRLFVYRLRHAQAGRLAATIQLLFGSGGGTGAGAGASVGRRSTLSQQLRDQRVTPFTPATPDSGQPPLTLPGKDPSIPAQLSGELQIVPDEATNSLLVRARPDDWTIVQQAIVALDLRPLQVLIEVLIAEVRQTRDLQVGISAKASRTGTGDNAVTGELKGPAATDFLLKLRRGGQIDVDVALAALASRGDVRILSRPFVLAQNNQEAKILVGAERPFVQVFRSLPTDGGVRDQVVQYRDVGTSLTIVPTINPDAYVNLDVVQEVSTATSELQFGAPVISTREASTRLFVRDGQTAVLGGLVDRQQDRSRSGIPILSDIPFIGALFGTTKTNTTTSELFLFLTPHIVESDEDLDDIKSQLEQRSRVFEGERPDSTTLLRGKPRPTPPDSAARSRQP